MKKKVTIILVIFLCCMVVTVLYFINKLNHLPIYHFEGKELYSGRSVLIPSQAVTTENIKTNFFPFWNKIGTVEQKEIGIEGSLHKFKQDGSTYVFYDSGVEMGWQTVYEYKKK